MTEELDAGPIYIKKDLPLNGRAEDIYSAAGKLSFKIISWIIKANPIPVEQQGEPTYFQRRKPIQSQLPFTNDVEKLYDFIRMLDAESYPSAFVKHGKIRLNLSNARIDGTTLTATVTFDLSNEANNEN